MHYRRLWDRRAGIATCLGAYAVLHHTCLSRSFPVLVLWFLFCISPSPKASILPSTPPPFVSSSIPYSLTLILANNQNIVHLSLQACEPCSSQWPAWILISLSQHVESSLGTDSSLSLCSLLESKKQSWRKRRQLFSPSQNVFPWSQLKALALFLARVLLFTECVFWFSTFALRVCRGCGHCCCVLFQATRSRLKLLDGLL